VLRSLAVCIALMDVTFMVPWAIWPLYSRVRLGLGPTGFGLLLTAYALGGLAGSVTVDRWAGRLPSPPTLLRAGLVAETLSHLVLASTRSPLLAYATLIVLGMHAAAWGAVSLAVRQRSSPPALLGRTLSTYALLSNVGAAVGALLGGIVAARLGLVAGFWLAGAAMAAVTAAMWRRLGAV
jgi:predicted MFS family arabinose efflux permease